jgi:hypothetical protein
MYIKAHPFGHEPIKNKHGRKAHYGDAKKKTQAIRMKNGEIRTVQHYVTRGGDIPHR